MYGTLPVRHKCGQGDTVARQTSRHSGAPEPHKRSVATHSARNRCSQRTGDGRNRPHNGSQKVCHGYEPRLPSPRLHADCPRFECTEMICCRWTLYSTATGHHAPPWRSEEHTSELQSHVNLVC